MLYSLKSIKLKMFLSLIAFIFCISSAKAQNSNTEMALYNIGFGSIFSGIGALINKKPNQSWDKVLLKGMWQGAIGGYLVYESKNLISKISKEERWEYSWYGKIINSAGTSIIENAASNRQLLEQWHLNIGFNRIEFYTKDKFSVKYKIMPVSLLLTLSVAIGNKFEIERSLETGEFIFSTSKTSGSNRGRAFGNVLLIRDQFFNDYDLYAHEIIHIYQYYDFNFVNKYLDKTYERWNQNSKSFTNFQNRFYIDLNGFVVWPLYFIQDGLGSNNFFENEADFYQH